MVQIGRSIGGSGERGAALVELAMVLPLLLVVIAGIVDFGLAFQRYEIVANAAREGARLGSKADSYDAAAVKQRVRDYVKEALNITNASDLDAVVPVGSISVTAPTVNVPVSSGTVALTATRVDVFYHHQFMLMRPIFGLINKAWGQSITLKATSVMSVEGS
jgi:Flp pilus assembly protein TadG